MSQYQYHSVTVTVSVSQYQCQYHSVTVTVSVSQYLERPACEDLREVFQDLEVSVVPVGVALDASELSSSCVLFLRPAKMPVFVEKRAEWNSEAELSNR